MINLLSCHNVVFVSLFYYVYYRTFFFVWLNKKHIKTRAVNVKRVNPRE